MQDNDDHPHLHLNFLREQNTDDDKFKFELWHKLNDLVHERIKKACDDKHEEEKVHGVIISKVRKQKRPLVPHNSLR